MRKDELQYLSDTLLIEQLASDSNGLKQASLFDDIGFNGIADHVKQFAQEHVRSDAPGGYVGSIINLMAPAVAWRIHPILGVVTTAAQLLGFDIVSMVKSILGGVSDKINSGEGVTLEEINSLGRGVASSMAGDSSSADDMLFPVRQAFTRTSLSGLPKVPFGYTKGAPLLQRIFGQLTRARGKWLIAGIVIWLLKTVLFGSLLIAGASVVKKIITPTQTEQSAQAPASPISPASPAQQTDKVPAPASTADPFKASGNGQQYFISDFNNIWVVPLLNGSIDDTLIAWAVDVYPELNGQEFAIESSSAFDNAVSMLKRNFNAKDSSNLIMPIGLHTRKQVVDLFAKDVKTLKE